MLKLLALFGLSLLVFTLIDLGWLLKVAPSMYQNYIGHLMAESFNGLAALLFYLLFHVGLLYFVLVPALKERSWSMVLIGALMYGLVTYGTYDLTNLATLKQWPWQITVIDLIWGSVLTVSTSSIVYALATLWNLL